MANHKLPFWRRRRYQLGAAIAAALIVAGLGANFYLVQEYQPAGAVNAYLTALEGRDAQAAWSATEVQATRGLAAASLVDAGALRRALALGFPDVRTFNVTGSHYLDADQTAAAVDVSYQTSSGLRQTTFQVVRGPERHFGIYPSWRVVIEPATLNLAPPPAASVVLIDGQAIQVAGQSVAVAVWPLHHVVSFPGTAMLEKQTVLVDLFDASSVSVAASPSLTPAGQSAALLAIKGAFTRCAAQTSLQPDGCPQRYDDPFTSTGSWRLVGDPTQSVATAFDKQENLVASGHYQMVLAYQGSYGTRHAAVAGGFVAHLVVGESEPTVASLGATTDVLGLERPLAATDDAIKAVVARGLAACAAIHSADPPDCPQQFFLPFAVLGWKMSGDPLAGATVTFDTASGVFNVHGTFQMSASYQDLGDAEIRPSSTTSYDATVLWDGSAAQLVTISGGYE